MKFQKFSWEGLTEPLPRPLPRSISGILGRFASSVRAAPSIHPSNMFNNPFPNRGVVPLGYYTKHCFPQTPTFWLHHWTQYIVPRLFTWINWNMPVIISRQPRRIFWKSSVMNALYWNIQYSELLHQKLHFSPECSKIVSGWGSAPDPAGGAYSAPPDPLAVMGWDFGNNFFWGANYVPPCSWPVPPCCFEAGYGPGFEWSTLKCTNGQFQQNSSPFKINPSGFIKDGYF